MKKLLYLSIAGLIAWSCSSEPQYRVEGKIDGSDSITFYLQKREGGVTVNIDSAVSKKGSFSMKGGKVDYPQLVQLVAGDTRKRTSFYLENAKITITGSLDSLFKASVAGSKSQDEYQSFLDSHKPLNDAYASLYSEYQAATQSGDASKVADIERRAEELQEKMLQNQKDFVLNNPASYVSPSLLSSLAYDMEADELESIVNKLDTSLAKLPQMAALRERVEIVKRVATGQKAPDFTMNDVDGKPVSLSSKIGSRLLLVDFWAAWCGPCRKENPNVVKVYKEFNKKGFDVFGVSLDQNREDWVKAIADDKLTWTHVSDLQYWSNAAAKTYGVQAIPANFLLDENGTIIAKNLRGDDLYSKVSELLNK